jgi:regulator of protease activity HflC (stomatin/prohibitin superfamily)
MTYTIVVVAVALTILAVVRGLLTTTTIYEYERGLRFRRGQFQRELGPGLYRYFRAYTTIQTHDTRLTHLPVSSQEVLTRDGVAIKVSLTATYQLVDIQKAVFNTINFQIALYTELQHALRGAVAAVDAETLLANRADMAPKLLQECKPAAAALGIDLHGVAIRDLTLPGEMKKIFAQVVKARQEGLAALERARGETAALRSLANAAQMVQRNPQLFQLRLLQVVGQQSGNTLVVGMPPGTATIPVRPSATELEATPPESASGPPDTAT